MMIFFSHEANNTIIMMLKILHHYNCLQLSFKVHVSLNAYIFSNSKLKTDSRNKSWDYFDQRVSIYE